MKSNSPQDTSPPPPCSGSSLIARGSRGARSNKSTRDSLRAQIRLLADDSPIVVASVRAALMRGGARIEKALKRACDSEDPRLRMRARDLLASFRRNAHLRRLIRTVSKPRIDLESALFRLGNLAADEFDARPYRRALDAMAEEVRKFAAVETDPRRTVLALSRYLGGQLNFRGAESDYHHPDNIHLFRVIERQTGMPLTLAALYLFVARRAGIRAAMVPLPGHVLLRLYYGQNDSLIIDPFRAGQVRTRADCVAYLRKCDLVPQPEWFGDASDEDIFLRHLMNLMASNRMRGHRARARELRKIAEILASVQTHRHPVLRD